MAAAAPDASDAAPAFEALYEVTGFDRINLGRHPGLQGAPRLPPDLGRGGGRNSGVINGPTAAIRHGLLG